MNNYQKLKEAVLAIEADAEKAYAGNKSAGTRTRNAMQHVKALAQCVRQTLPVKKED
jgi:hypothetical protein